MQSIHFILLKQQVDQQVDQQVGQQVVSNQFL